MNDYITLHLSQQETTVILDALSKLPLYQAYGLFQKVLQEDQLARKVIASAQEAPTKEDDESE